MGNILYLEDEHALMSALVETLEMKGHNVIESASIAETVKRLEECEILLLDIMMTHGKEFDDSILSVKTGIELMRRLKEKEEICGVIVQNPPPIIVITGVGSVSDHAAIRRLDAVGVFPKPIRIEKVVERIEECIGVPDDGRS